MIYQSMNRIITSAKSKFSANLWINRKMVYDFIVISIDPVERANHLIG